MPSTSVVVKLNLSPALVVVTVVVCVVGSVVEGLVVVVVEGLVVEGLVVVVVVGLVVEGLVVVVVVGLVVEGLVVENHEPVSRSVVLSEALSSSPAVFSITSDTL